MSQNEGERSTHDGPKIIILSKVNQTKKRQVSHDITYMWNLKYNTNELAKQKQTHRHRKQTYGYQRGKGEEG